MPYIEANKYCKCFLSAVYTLLILLIEIIALRRTETVFYKLVVENNLQVKNAQILSGKMGLKNISSKYKLMKFGDITIIKNEDCFRFAVPLIK